MLAATNNDDQKFSAFKSNGGRHSGLRGRRPGRRRGGRVLAASLIAVGGTAAAASSVSAAPAPPDPGSHSIEGSIEEYNPVRPTIPEPTMPSVGIAAAEDLLRGGIVMEKLPEGHTVSDDDADPEVCADDCDEREIVETVIGDEGEDPGQDPGKDDPAECGEDELVECPGEEVVPEDDCRELPEQKYNPGYDPEDCDTPDETTTTVTPSTTSTTIYDFEEVDVEVEDEVAERNDGALAFTGSNSMLPLAGAGLLAAGVVVAGLSLAARRRADAQGEA